MTGSVTSSGQAEASISGGGGYGTIVPIRSSDRARELAHRRWDAVAAATRRGIVKAGAQLPGISGHSPLPVVEYLAEVHTLNAADPSAAGAAQSYKLVMDRGFPKPERSQDEHTPADTLAHALGTELARHVLARLRGET